MAAFASSAGIGASGTSATMGKEGQQLGRDRHGQDATTPPVNRVQTRTTGQKEVRRVIRLSMVCQEHRPSEGGKLRPNGPGRLGQNALGEGGTACHCGD